MYNKPYSAGSRASGLGQYVYVPDMQWYSFNMVIRRNEIRVPLYNTEKCTSGSLKRLKYLNSPTENVLRHLSRPE